MKQVEEKKVQRKKKKKTEASSEAYAANPSRAQAIGEGARE